MLSWVSEGHKGAYEQGFLVWGGAGHRGTHGVTCQPVPMVGVGLGFETRQEHGAKLQGWVLHAPQQDANWCTWGGARIRAIQEGHVDVRLDNLVDQGTCVRVGVHGKHYTRQDISVK
jgi:hypothetical protein